MTAITLQKGGRAVGRVLPTLCLSLLCLLGLLLMARGAIIPAKAWTAQILLERAFDRSIVLRQPVKPWPWADTAPVARVSVPRLGISEIVLSGGSGQAMAFGPTLMPGQGRVRIMAAHRDTHFAFLKDVRRGDRIMVQSVTGTVAQYDIVGSQIVRWDRFAYARNPARSRIALVTCYPVGAIIQDPLRLVVWAEQR